MPTCQKCVSIWYTFLPDISHILLQGLTQAARFIHAPNCKHTLVLDKDAAIQKREAKQNEPAP